MKKEGKEIKEKKVKPAKKQKGEKKDLTTLMNILMVIGSIVICVGLTYLSISIQYPDGIKKVTAVVTGAFFADIVAFTFVGVLVMYGIRKLVLRK